MIGLNKRASVSMRAQFLMTEVVEEQQIIVGTSVDAMINEVTGRQVPCTLFSTALVGGSVFADCSAKQLASC